MDLAQLCNQLMGTKHPHHPTPKPSCTSLLWAGHLPPPFSGNPREEWSWGSYYLLMFWVSHFTCHSVSEPAFPCLKSNPTREKGHIKSHFLLISARKNASLFCWPSTLSISTAAATGNFPLSEGDRIKPSAKLAGHGALWIPNVKDFHLRGSDFSLTLLCLLRHH